MPHLRSYVHPVVLGEGDGDGGIQTELVGGQVGQLLLLAVHAVQQGVQLRGRQQNARVILPYHTLALHAHFRHLGKHMSSALAENRQAANIQILTLIQATDIIWRHNICTGTSTVGRSHSSLVLFGTNPELVASQDLKNNSGNAFL